MPVYLVGEFEVTNPAFRAVSRGRTNSIAL